MKMEKHTSAVIWDLGGVILRTEDLSFREKWEARLGLDPWGLAEIVFHNPVSQRASIGEATVDDIWNEVQTLLGLKSEDLFALRKDFFAGDQIDQELVGFIRDLKPKSKTGLISNAWPDIRHWIETEWHIDQVFDHMLISAEIQIAKPDLRIYHLSLQALNIVPECAIFVDDFIENVQGAHAAGMQAVHFQSADQARAEILDLLKQME
jgi:epoxide hydrolase-like predicted phosphatase